MKTRASTLKAFKWLLFGALAFSSSFSFASATILQLPISKNFDQGKTGLCWAYSILSALETRYMVLHPGESIELSRGFLQYGHFLLKAQSQPISPLHEKAEDGFFGEAVDIITTLGVAPFTSYPDATYKNYNNLRSLQNSDEFLMAINKMFRPLPKKILWQQQEFTPQQFAQALLGQDRWTDIAVAKNGEQGMGQNPDVGAPEGRQALFLPLNDIVNLIKANLQKGIPTAYATDSHATLIYGAKYDESGNPIEYLIKDSFMGMTYVVKAPLLHNLMSVVNTIY